MKPFAIVVAAIGPAALVGTLGRLSVDSAWVERLGWTLIHTVWQFALVAFIAAAVHWSLRRRSARARYVAGVILLAAMAAAPVLTSCVVDVSRPTDEKQTRTATNRTADEKPSREDVPLTRAPMDESADRDQPLAQTAPPSRHAAEPRAVAVQAASRIAPHERASSACLAAVRLALAPRLPLCVSLWLAGMALFSLRPVWGLWMQWRLRRVGLSPVPAWVAQSLDDLARRLGLRRTVGIAQSVRVRVPMAVGYLRPLILLPGCVLTGLTAAQLEALLAHELAHIRRHDWLVNAFQLLVETVFFYHPAVWWISRQIRQERENCCDDLAISLVGDRGTVGRMLLALEELRERTPGLALAATGGNLLSRVRRVVAKGRQPEPAGREWLPAAVLLVLAGLGGAAWATSAGSAEKKSSTTAASAPATPPATPKANAPSEAKNDAKPAAKTPEVRRITGRVIDSQGQPVTAARLRWVVLDDPLTDQFTVQGTSDAQGHFALEAPAAWKPRPPVHFPADTLWVFAPGKELTGVRATKPAAGDNKEHETGGPLEISLAPATEIDYTVSDEEGRPVAGAVVEFWHYLAPRGYALVPRNVRELLRRTTDASGRVRLDSVSSKALYDVQIQAAHFGTQQQRVAGPGVALPQGKITLRATGRIEGRLTADDPKLVRGIQLMVSTQQPRQSLKSISVTLPDRTKDVRTIYETDGVAPIDTDAEGRFHISEIASGSIFIVPGPRKSDFVPRLTSGLSLKAGQTVRIDIPMERLVLVKGTIRTDDPPAPVVGAEISVGYGKWFQAEMTTSDRQGHYAAHVLAGPVTTQVVGMPQDLRTRYEQTGEPWNDRIPVPAGKKEFELPPIVLMSTETRTGTLVDQHGRPIAGAWVAANRGTRRYGFAVTNARGEFSLRLPKKIGMDSYTIQIPDRELVRTKATILKYEPFTLQFSVPETGDKRPKTKQEPSSTATDKRQQTDERKLTASAAPAPPLSSPAYRASILLAAKESKPSTGVPTLAGKVSDSDGKPTAGATVMIWAAGVKRGYSTYCPGCYADCGKRAATDAAGAFAIAHVDPELRFRLLIVREGYAPVFAEKVDPFGGPVAVRLSRRSSPDDPRQAVHGHVVGPRGEPLAGAVVEAEAVAYQDKNGRNSRTWGAPKGLDPLAVTNEQGDFEIAYAKPASSITVMVRARGLAPQRFAALGTGAERHTLALNRGASIRGRLVSHGQPVGHAEMGLVARDRMVDNFYSEVRIGTEPDGSFLFVNVPVPGQWYVYAKMDSVHTRGATNALECVTEQDDETVKLGDVTLQPGHRLRGRVILADGKPVPDGMRILLSAQRAWDNQTHDLPADGRFEFDGLPTDDFSIHPAVKGYHPSPKNPNRNLGIDGFIDRDVDNFVILLDPGKERFDRMGENFRGKPLRSAPQP